MQYATVKIRQDTYKELKILSAQMDISIIELIDQLYKTRKEEAITANVLRHGFSHQS